MNVYHDTLAIRSIHYNLSYHLFIFVRTINSDLHVNLRLEVKIDIQSISGFDYKLSHMLQPL